jgi:hypothetical protein
LLAVGCQRQKLRCYHSLEGHSAAAAQAAGQVGQAGAYGGALNSINQAIMLSQLPDIAAAMKGQ